jgi:hypothetical protein
MSVSGLHNSTAVRASDVGARLPIPLTVGGRIHRILVGCLGVEIRDLIDAIGDKSWVSIPLEKNSIFERRSEIAQNQGKNDYEGPSLVHVSFHMLITE